MKKNNTEETIEILLLNMDGNKFDGESKIDIPLSYYNNILSIAQKNGKTFEEQFNIILRDIIKENKDE